MPIFGEQSTVVVRRVGRLKKGENLLCDCLYGWPEGVSSTLNPNKTVPQQLAAADWTSVYLETADFQTVDFKPADLESAKLPDSNNWKHSGA
jgi:hypothetical protein